MTSLTVVIYLAAAGRVLIGLGPIAAARPVARLLGFPDAHDNPTTRLMARLFGIRDIGLGALMLAALHGQASLGFALLFNAAHDVADAAAISVPLLRRQGIDRAAGLSLLFALGGCATWLALFVLSR